MHMNDYKESDYNDRDINFKIVPDQTSDIGLPLFSKHICF